MARKSSSKSGKQKKTLAEKADKFICYQESVQTPEHEIEFFEQAYREAFRRKPLRLREDFCGTFSVCCRWVQSDKQRTDIGVDLCEETLEWGRQHNLSTLSDDQGKRLRIVQQDVRKRNRPQADILAAQNFSFWLFKTRQEVIEYFKIARSNLAANGVMVMDMMGGSECLEENHVDKRTIKKGKKGFKYHWDQDRYDPVTGDATFYIHFKFSDGSKLKRAFEYHWRFWTIPEVREMLEEAGFSESHVYWEDDEDNTWHRASEAPSDPSWICYIVAVKDR